MRNLNYLIRSYRTSSKKGLTLPDTLDEIIIGCMLGDLTAEKPSANSNTRLQFKQSLKNQPYIEHLYLLFQEYCGSKPIKMSSFDQRPSKNKEYRSIKFQTLSLPIFNKYKDLFYNQEGIKIIPQNIESLLTVKGLAYWLMDDGYNSTTGFYICTDSYSYDDHQILISVLNTKFKLNCSAHKTTNGYRLYIHSSSKRDFFQLVKPYVLSHFDYKFNSK